jgi:hypothetical protein
MIVYDYEYNYNYNHDYDYNNDEQNQNIVFINDDIDCLIMAICFISLSTMCIIL